MKKFISMFIVVSIVFLACSSGEAQRKKAPAKQYKIVLENSVDHDILEVFIKESNSDSYDVTLIGVNTFEPGEVIGIDIPSEKAINGNYTIKVISKRGMYWKFSGIVFSSRLFVQEEDGVVYYFLPALTAALSID